MKKYTKDQRASKNCGKKKYIESLLQCRLLRVFMKPFNESTSSSRPCTLAMISSFIESGTTTVEERPARPRTV